jgi:hypothetical protein
MKLYLATVDQREEIPADGQEHHEAEAEHQHCDNGNDGSPPPQHLQQFRISITQAREP